ncbi:hypothetical protein MASR1M60_11000 [Rhodocyclaceae bacterium]
MPYKVHVVPHPLGVVIDDREGGRELLIEGEGCCGKTFEQLKQIATSTHEAHELHIDAETASKCRLKRR